MYTETQLEAIKLFGRKDLTEGCIINLRDEDDYDNDGHICKLTQPSEYDESGWYLIYPHTPYGATDAIHIKKDKDSIYEILGHIPHLEDLFRVAEERGFGHCNLDNDAKYFFFIKGKETIEIPYNPSLPLIDQPEATLKELLALFK